MVNKEKKTFWEDCYNVNIPDEIRATISEESKTKILKATEAFADILYGITMQESGVSKLVSVRLEDHDELL